MKTRSRYVFGAALAACGLCALSSASNAAIVNLMSVNFNSPTYSNGALITPPTATDTTTEGQDHWLSTSAGLTNNITVQNAATDGFVTMTTSGQDVRRLFDASATVTSGSIWFSLDMNASAAQATGDYAFSLGDGGATNFNARAYLKSSGAGYVMALNTGSGTPVTYGATVLPFNTVEHLLVRYDFVAGTANDTGALFINPTSQDGSADTAYVAATTSGTDATTLSAFYLRQGTAGSAATLASVDNILVFTSTGGVTPEPTSLSLLSLGAMGLVARRRRNK